MNYNQAMAAARQGQLISLNGNVMALLAGAQLTHEALETPLVLRTMLYVIEGNRAIPFTPSVMDKESQMWGIADTQGVDTDELWEGRAILTVTNDPRFVEAAYRILCESKMVKIEMQRTVDESRSIEFFLVGKHLPLPQSGKKTEQVIMVVEQSGSGVVCSAHLSGPSGNFVV